MNSFHLPLNFFQTVASVHPYNTRLASESTYYINNIKTNNGKFNIRFAAVKSLEYLDESYKHFHLKMFKKRQIEHLAVLLFKSFEMVFTFFFFFFFFFY